MEASRRNSWSFRAVSSMSFSRIPDSLGAVPFFHLIPAASRMCFAVLGLCLLSLSACNYTPALAPEGASDGLMGSIAVQEPRSQDGYAFVTRLEERLGRPKGARYQLSYSIVTSTEGVGRKRDQRITRFNLNGAAEYQLVDVQEGKTVHSGKVENHTSYSATIPLANSRAATRDASQRLMVILADQVAVRILASYRGWSG